MIYKSYIVENNLNILKEKMVLFYGENTGLISDIKKKIKTIYRDCEILSYDQDDVLKNTEAVFSDVLNISLFSQKKVYLIILKTEKLYFVITGMIKILILIFKNKEFLKFLELTI